MSTRQDKVNESNRGRSWDAEKVWLAPRPSPGQGWSVLFLLLSLLWLPEWEHRTQDWFWWRLTQFPRYFPSTHWKAPWREGTQVESVIFTEPHPEHGEAWTGGTAWDNLLGLGGWVQGQDRGCRDRGHLVGGLASWGLERACSVSRCEEQRRRA